jgi:hypothetical protein
MGTNFYRLPTDEEMVSRKSKLCEDVNNMDISISSIINSFRKDNQGSPWKKFLSGLEVHLGKRSKGWKFGWNFNNEKYYSNKEELLKFIREGRIIDEYGALWDTEEFIDMSFNWEQPNGLIYNVDYEIKNNIFHGSDPDKIIDGLRVIPTNKFS